MQTLSDAFIQSIERQINHYDRIALLQAIAALQLHPTNASHLLRLELLASVIVHAQNHDSAAEEAPIIEDVLSVVNSAPLASSQIVDMEDPWQNPWCEEAAFSGGSYRFFPGLVNEAGFILRHTLRAFMQTSTKLDRDIFRRLFVLVTATLRLSDAIADRAGATRHQRLEDNLPATVVVPESTTWQNLCQAVLFTTDDLTNLFAPYELNADLLKPLMMDGLTGDPPTSLDDGTVLERPVIHIDGGYIVAAPHRLVSALTEFIIAELKRTAAADEFLTHFLRSVRRSTEFSLELLGNTVQLSRRIHPHRVPYGVAATCSLDADKLLCVLTVVDDLGGVAKASDVRGDWTTLGPVMHGLEKRARTMERHLQQRHPQLQLLFLVVVQGFGREGQISEIHLPGGSRVAITSAADLETMATLGAGDRMGLWSCVDIITRLRTRGQVVSWSLLTDFFAWRYSAVELEESVRTEALVYIPVDTIGRARQLAHQAWDRHAVEYPGDFVVDVYHLYEDPQLPIYGIVEAPDVALRVVVDGLDVPIWILDGSNVLVPDPQHRSLQQTFIHAIAQGICRLTPYIRSLVGDIRQRYPVVTILVECPLSPEWFVPPAVDSEATEGIHRVVDRESGTLTIEILPTSRQMFFTPDNAGDRELLWHVLEGLAELADHDPVNLAVALDQAIPLGFQKLVIYLNAGRFPVLDNRDLLPLRLVSEDAWTRAVMDVSEQFLRQYRALRHGTVDDGSVGVVLKDLVAAAFELLRQEFSDLSSQNLMEFLLAHSESVIHAQHATPSLLPSDPNGMDHSPWQLQDKMSGIVRTAISLRFLIEYAVACPPRGSMPVSEDRYDGLLALAHIIVEWGTRSDLEHFHLARTAVRILPSGLVEIDQDAYMDTQQNYASAYYDQLTTDASTAYAALWSAAHAGPDEDDDFLRQVNTATEEQFGISVADMNLLLRTLQDIGDTEQPDASVHSSPRSDVVQSLTARLGWPVTKVEQGIDALSLTARDGFFTVPQPWKPYETFPWRFGREYSLLRRPLLERSGVDGQPSYIYWGDRHLELTKYYLADLLASGRMAARTPLMKRLMAAIHSKRGAAFHQAVAAVFDDSNRFTLKTSVKKIGGLKLQTGQNDLGDIDVLVADRATKQLWVIECKNLNPARTPWELYHEWLDLTADKARKPSIIRRHSRRTEWVAANLETILTELEINDPNRWQIRPAIVTSHPLPGTYLESLSIPVITMNGLRDIMNL